VNTWPVGELADQISKVTEAEVEGLLAEYRSAYAVATDDLASVRYQAKEELAIERILVREGAAAYSNTFQDLWGLEQLPGLATQNLMAKGYGYGAEGDWKTAAMTHVVKAMTQGLDGGTSFRATSTCWVRTCWRSVLR
jgi:L-arabinose isomerase